MGTLYESIKSLCDERGISGGKMCVDLNISKSTMTDLKKGRRSGISLENAQKIADYFEVSIERVLGTEQKENPATASSEVSEKDIRLINWFRSLPEEKQRAILVSQDAPTDVL